MGDDQKQDKFKDLGGTFRLDTTVPQASSTEGAPAQVRQPIPAPAQSPNKVDEIREATNPDEAAKRIGQGFESTVTGGLKMLGDIVLPPGKTEGERLKYLGKKYVTDPLNTAAAAALKQGPGIGQVATVGEALPGVGPMAVAPVVEGVRAASKSPTAALETAQTTAGVAGALALAEPAMKGLKGASEGAVSGLGETAQTFGGAAGEEVGNMARATAPEGSTEAGRVKLNVKGKAEPAKAAIPEPVGVHHDDLPYQAKYQDVDFSARDLQDSEKKVTAETVRKDYASGNKTASIYQSYIPMEDLPTGSVEEDFDREDYLRPRTGAPIKVQVAPDGQLEILDGNHRAIMWDEQGKQYAPAWVVDYRHPDIENLSEDEKAERTEMEAEPAATEPTIEHEPIGRQGGLVTLKDNGKEVGRVRYTIPQEERPASASVTAANLEPEYRGKGYGQKLYLRAADELRQQGIPAMTSDLKGSTTMDAARVWDKLAEKGHPIEQIESTKAGSPAYKWDLTKPQVAPKAIDFSEIGGKTVREARNENRIQTENVPTGHDEAANRVGAEPVSRGEGEGQGVNGKTVRAESPKISSEPEEEEEPTFGFGEEVANEKIKRNNAGKLRETTPEVNRQNVASGKSGNASQSGQETTKLNRALKSKPEEGDESFEFGANAPAAEAAGKYHPDLQKVVDKIGTSDSPSGASAKFITPDGKFLNLSGKTHPEIIESTTGERPEEDLKSLGENMSGNENPNADSRVRFLNDTGAVRTRTSMGEFHASVPAHGVTPEQIDALKADARKAVGRDGRIVIERADVTPETKDQLSKVVEHGNANNIEPMLRDIQAHPDKTAAGWSEKAADMGAKQGGFTINPNTGEAPKTGFQVSLGNDFGVKLDHPATAADIQKFHADNKALFDANPELHVGGYQNELNVSANVKDQATATRIAKKLDQESIWDNKNAAEVKTGGANAQDRFPNYPVEERMNDMRGKPQSNIPKFENVPQRVYDKLTPDARKYLADDPKLQQRMMAEIHKEPLTEGEAVTSAAASSDINGWWRRFNDIHDRIGDAGSTKTNQYGVRYGDISKAFHSALSGNKLVEDANNLAWGSMYDWLKAGEPIDRASINAIIRDNGAAEAGELGPTGAPKKGNAAMSDTLNKKGKVTHENLDTTELWRLVNSPEMRGEKPFSGNIWSETSPIEAKGAQARKLPSMLATTAGGDLSNAVIDTILSRFMGKKSLPATEAKYLADTVFLRGVGDTMNLPTGEAQEQIWTTTQSFLTHIKNGLTPEQAADKIIHEGTYSTGKDYADIILNDPEVSGKGGYLDKLKTEFGIGPGSDGIADLHQQTRDAQPPKESTAGPLNKSDLTATGERIRGTLNENRIKKPTNPDLVPALQKSVEGLKKPGRDFSQWSAPSPTLKSPLEGLSKPGAKAKK